MVWGLMVRCDAGWRCSERTLARNECREAKGRADREPRSSLNDPEIQLAGQPWARYRQGADRVSSQPASERIVRVRCDVQIVEKGDGGRPTNGLRYLRRRRATTVCTSERILAGNAPWSPVAGSATR